MPKKVILNLLAVLGLMLCPIFPGFTRADDTPTTQPATAPAALDEEIAPYVSAATLAVVRIDTTQIDLDAIQDLLNTTLLKAIDKPGSTTIPADVDANMENARRVADEFKATGATKLYGVMTFNPASGNGVAVMLLIPTGPTVDIPSLTNLLLTGHSKETPGAVEGPEAPQVRIVKNALLWGNDESLDFLVATEPDPRPDIVAALAAGGDAPDCQAFCLPSAVKITIGLLVGPALPPALGGGATMPVIQGFTWASFSMTSPASGSAKLVIQCASPDAAQAIQKALTAGIKTLQNKTIPNNLPNAALDLSKVMDQLTPTIDGSQLISEIKGDAFNDALVAFMRAAAEAQGTPPAQ